MSKKVFVGKITSIKMKDTVVVAVEMPKKHPKYAKILKNTVKFKAHTTEKLELGDKVRIQESNPISKTKKWLVIERVK